MVLAWTVMTYSLYSIVMCMSDYGAVQLLLSTSPITGYVQLYL